MEIPVLVPLLAAKSDFLLALWLAYAGFAAALLGWAACVPAVGRCRFTFAAVAGFAVTHLMCLQWVLKQWAALAAVLKAKLAADPALADMLAGSGFTEAPDFLWVVPFHVGLDVLLLVGLRRASRPGGRP